MYPALIVQYIGIIFVHSVNTRPLVTCMTCRSAREQSVDSFFRLALSVFCGLEHRACAAMQIIVKILDAVGRRRSRYT